MRKENKMISRKKILSRSQSDMDYSSNYNAYQCDEDVWYNKEKLYSDHILEIFKKWEQIDDEIWGKIICMERNRRIAKAYARVPLLTINGGTEGFDGFKIGLMGFDNPLEDNVIKRVKHNIFKGVRIKIDDTGNIIVKRLSSSDVFIKGYDRDSCAIGKDLIEANGILPADTSFKLFDLKKFQQNISKELRNACPNRQKLESQCIVVIGFVKDCENILELPVWCMLINIVALEMLKSRLPPVLYRNTEFSNYNQNLPKFVSIFDKKESQSRQIADEDPYSVPSLPKLITDVNMANGASGGSSGGSATSNSRVDNYSYHHQNLYFANRVMQPQQLNQHQHILSAQKYHHQQQLSNLNKSQREKENNPTPPELPPRDFNKNNNVIPKKTKSRNFAKVFRFRKSGDERKKKAASAEDKQLSENNLNDATTNEIEYEDPYYFGIQARVSNFSNKQRKSLAVPPVQNYINNLNNGQHHQYLRKANSNGYLNSLFNPTSNFYPNSKNSYYSQYDSSFESDPYAISSNENAYYYAVYGGRIHPNVYPSQPVGYRRSPPQENYIQQSVFNKIDRYATEWD